MTRVKGISIIVLVVAVASDAARLQEDPSSTSSLQGPASRRVKRVRRDSEAATSHWASVYSRSSGFFCRSVHKIALYSLQRDIILIDIHHSML